VYWFCKVQLLEPGVVKSYSRKRLDTVESGSGSVIGEQS
jgi:hypothetical protein